MNHGAAEPPPDESRSAEAGAFALATALFAAFGAYFCMYAFRKPFTAAAFADYSVAGVAFKSLIVTAQVLGYMVAKALGVKFVSEMPHSRRAAALLLLVGLAESTLLLFGLLPRPLNAVCFFLNGLSLGMVFGLVLSFLEGRRMTEMLAAGLCASFIVADGVVKSVGTWLLALGIPEDWMPAVAGALFLAPFGIFVGLLARVPPPSGGDVAARNERGPLQAAERRKFLSRYAPGLIPLVIMFLLVTIARSIRADFGPEIWRDLGVTTAPSTFTWSETMIALGVTVVNGAAVLVSNNRRAFFTSLAVCGFGFVVLAASLTALRAGVLGGYAFMVLAGFGLYIPYVAVHTTIFERILAIVPDRGNVGFLLYVADSIGYLAYAGIIIAKPFISSELNFLGLMKTASWVAAVISILCLAASARFFAKVGRRDAPGGADSGG